MGVDGAERVARGAGGVEHEGGIVLARVLGRLAPGVRTQLGGNLLDEHGDGECPQHVLRDMLLAGDDQPRAGVGRPA